MPAADLISCHQDLNCNGGFEMSVQSTALLQPLFLAPKAYCSVWGVLSLPPRCSEMMGIGPSRTRIQSTHSLRLPEMSALYSEKFYIPKKIYIAHMAYHYYPLWVFFLIKMRLILIESNARIHNMGLMLFVEYMKNVDKAAQFYV